MKIIKCDICGAMAETDEEKRKYVVAKKRFVKNAPSTTAYFDLCPRCLKEHGSWFDFVDLKANDYYKE